ncbi:MAG: TniQ family protein [Pleurocapsa sp. MO_226.B13]|nr:TniQ family protein [Pleurocapsa sp. MO_226.B13]
MNDTNEVEPWLFPVEPYDEESLSHFLGRFRRQNYLSPSALGDLAGIGGVVARWERFHLNPFPTHEQFQALAKVVGVDSFRLRDMLPPQGIGMKCEPIRLCGACYGEVPCHRLEWQYKSVWKCDRHKLKLISKCPNCRAKFKSPSLWEFGCCHRCHLPFSSIGKFQKPA